MQRNAIQVKKARDVRTGDFVRVSFTRFKGFHGPTWAERNPDIEENVLLNAPGYTWELGADDDVEVLERVRLPRDVLERPLGDQLTHVAHCLLETGWPTETVVDFCQYLRAGDAQHRASALEDVFQLV